MKCLGFIFLPACTTANAAIPQVPSIADGHETYVTAAEMSSDGRFIITGAGDGIRVWDTQTCTPTRSLNVGEAGISGLKLLADDHTILAATKWGSLFRWDVNTGHLRRLTSRPRFGVLRWERSLFPADGRFVLNYAENGQVEVDSSATGRVLQKIDFSRYLTAADKAKATAARNTYQLHLTKPVLSPDGNWLAAAGYLTDSDDPKRTPNTTPAPQFLWNLQHQKMARIERGQRVREILAFSPDSRSVVAPGISQYGEWLHPQLQDFKTGALRRQLPAEFLHSIYSPDLNFFAGQEADNTLHIRDTRTGKTATVQSITDDSQPVTFLASSTLLASADQCGTVMLSDAATGQPRFQLPASTGHETARAISPDGRRLVTQRGQTLNVWDLPNAQLEHTYHLPLNSFRQSPSLIVSPDARLAAVLDVSYRSDPSGLHLLNLNTGSTTRLNVDPQFLSQVAFSPDNSKLILGRNKLGYDEYLNRWWRECIVEQLDLTADTISWSQFVSGRRLVDLTVSPDGTSVAALIDSRPEPPSTPLTPLPPGEVRIWDLTGKLQRTLTTAPLLDAGLAYSPVGHQILTLARGRVHIQDAQSGALLATLPGIWDQAALLNDHIVVTQSGPTRNAGFYWPVEHVQVVRKVWDIRGNKPRESKDLPYQLPYIFRHGQPAAAGNAAGVQLLTGSRATFLTREPDNPGGETQWLIYTDAGYYTGSRNIEKFMRWPVEDKLVSGDTLISSHRNPGEVQRRLNAPK